MKVLQLTKKIVLAVLLTLSTSIIFAQEPTEEPKKKMQITAFNLEFGSNGAFTILTNEDYLKMKNSAVDPSLFISNPEDYDLSYSSGSGASFSPSVSIGITPYSKKNNDLNYNREIRIKLGGNFGNRRSFSYYNDTTAPYDTLISSVTNSTIYLDSTHRSYHSYMEIISEVNIGISYLFKTDASKRWHFYTGGGIEYGFAFQDYVSIYDNESTSYHSNNSENYYVSYHDPNYEYNYTDTKSKLTSHSHFVRLYVPIGVNFRIANNNDFFKHINLYASVSPGIEFQIIPNVNTYTSPFIGMAFLGIRYTVN